MTTDEKRGNGPIFPFPVKSDDGSKMIMPYNDLIFEAITDLDDLTEAISRLGWRLLFFQNPDEDAIISSRDADIFYLFLTGLIQMKHDRSNIIDRQVEHYSSIEIEEEVQNGK